jgi:hypothetical protein
MSLRWQRWIAIWMLALAAFGASAAACATLCAAEHGMAMSDTMADQDSTEGGCPMAQLCSLAVSPAILTETSSCDLIASAYVVPLAPDRPCDRDADPPQKPPSA